MRKPAGERLTAIILSIFRANGLLLSAGDELVAPLGLTSARWQVMGSVALADRPISAPQIAATMGITRQGVQKQINQLVGEKLLEAVDNPTNRRSPLFLLTRKGSDQYQRIEALQAEWVNSLVAGIPMKDLEATARVLDKLKERLARTAL